MYELRAACHIGQMVDMHWGFLMCLWSRIQEQNIIIVLGNDTDLQDNCCSLPLSFWIQGESFVKARHYAPFKGGNCYWGTFSASPVMHILYCSLRQETQSYGIYLRPLNLLKDAGRNSSWNMFENKNRSRQNVVPLGFPLIIWLHMFNITNQILFHKITFTPSGLCSPFAYNILSFYKHTLGLEGSTWPYRLLTFTQLISGCSWSRPDAHKDSSNLRHA